jgi:hypothetical protein
MPRVNSSMTIVVIIVSLVILGIFNIALADPDPANSQSDFSIKHGTKALQFQLGSAFSYRTDNSLALAGKYYLSPRSALRLGISFGGSDETSDDNYASYSSYDSSFHYTVTEYNQERQTIAITLQYLKFHQISPKLNFLWGIGPSLRFNRNNDDNTITIDDTQWINYKYNRTSISPGFSGLLGAEWQINHRISLTAEYGIEIYYSHSTSEDSRDDYSSAPRTTSKSKDNSFGWNSLGTNMGVNIFF